MEIMKSEDPIAEHLQDDCNCDERFILRSRRTWQNPANQMDISREDRNVISKVKVPDTVCQTPECPELRFQASWRGLCR
jgi:hypothetical protein